MTTDFLTLDEATALFPPRRDWREWMEPQAAELRVAGHGAINQGVFFADDENLFSGPAAERATVGRGKRGAA